METDAVWNLRSVVYMIMLIVMYMQSVSGMKSLRAI